MTTSRSSAPLLELAHPGFPERLAVLEHGDALTLVEVVLEPGGGTPLHVHHSYVEHFEVLEGHLDVQLGSRVLRLGPGERTSAPARIPHRFTNATDEPTRFHVRIAPGQPGFIDMQRVLFGLRADGLVDADGNPRDPRHIAVALGWADTAPPTAGAATMMRIFRLAACLTGVKRDLARRYLPADAD